MKLLVFCLALGLQAQTFNVGNLGNLSSNAPWVCNPASASGTAYICTPTLLDGTAIPNSQLSAPVNGQQLIFIPDVANTGSLTIQIDGSTNHVARFWTGLADVNFVSGDLLAAVPILLLWRGGIWTTNPARTYQNGTNWGVGTGFKGTGSVSSSLNPYAGVATVGLGVPAIYANGRSTAQTAAVASVSTFTVGASDGSFLVSANVLVTASTTHNFTVTVAYTDEGNTARTLTLNFSQITGTLLTAITNVQGVGAYEGVPLHVRCKASTTITVATTGTFTSVTYNVEGFIIQIG